MSDKSKLPVLVVVDDEEPILRAMRSLLRRDGYQMHFFTSGREALKFLEKNNADIIISDMRMPEMTGSEVLEKSIKLCPNSIRIILSGFEEKSIILEALSAGLAKHYVMKPWEDDQLRQLIKGSIELQRRLRHEHIQELLLSIKNLPSPPNWYSKLMHLLKHDDYSQKLIAYEIEKSPELVAKLLRVSNSVFYGMRRMISTVYEALTFIGTEATLNIVLAIESFDIVSANAGPKVARKIDEMRKEAVIRAHIAREIALNWSSENNPHEAYVAGLLLEIGLVLRFYSSENSFMKFIEFQEKEKSSHYEIDKVLYETGHDELGAALLTYWNFPENITNAIANHHGSANNDPLTTTVQIANRIVLEEDAVPCDDEIEELAEKWKVKLKYFIDRYKTSDP